MLVDRVAIGGFAGSAAMGRKGHRGCDHAKPGDRQSHVVVLFPVLASVQHDRHASSTTVLLVGADLLLDRRRQQR